MQIESVEVIPMSKESKWEDAPKTFEVSMITTDYVKWLTSMYDEYLDSANSGIDGACILFAKRQQAFMLAPTAIFGSTVYCAVSRVTETLDNLQLDGPLYRVQTLRIDDKDSGKSVERLYTDPETFNKVYGLWYPEKKVYKVRYGQVIDTGIKHG